MTERIVSTIPSPRCRLPLRLEKVATSLHLHDRSFSRHHQPCDSTPDLLHEVHHRPELRPGAGTRSQSPLRARAQPRGAGTSTLLTTFTVDVKGRDAPVTGTELFPRSEPPYHRAEVAPVAGVSLESRDADREADRVARGVILHGKQASLVKPSSSLTPRSGAGMSGEAREHGASNSAKLR